MKKGVQYFNYIKEFLFILNIQFHLLTLFGL